MKKIYYLLTMFFLLAVGLSAQESILIVKSPYVVQLNAETGDVEDAQFIDLGPLSPGTPKAVRQINDEIWVTDQIADAIFRFDMDGNYISTITGNMDNIKGLEIVNGTEVWVTNAGNNNGAHGDSVVRFDTDGNYLGYFLTDGSSFDILDVGGGEVYISYINSGSPIEVRDYDGDFLRYMVPPNTLNFLEQMWITDDGDLLFTAFSSPAGIYLYDIDTGNQLDYWAQSSPRGVIETGNGNYLWSSGSGIYRLDPDTSTNTMILSGSSQFFALINPDGGGGGEECTTPTLSVDEPDAVCEGNSVTFTATSNGDEVRWYDSETSTTPIHTGSSFTTPDLSATTSYWVQAFSFGSGGSGETITEGARVAPTSNSNSSVVAGTSPWGLSFDADVDFTIDAVDVYLTGAAGTLVMELLDENWAALDTKTIATPAGNSGNPVQYEVELGFEVEAGNTYRLVASSSPDMIREFSSEHPGFPYPIGDAGTVTGGTINNSHTNNTVYYFFYNWTVTKGGASVCTSDRLEVAAEVTPAPATPEGDADQYFTLGQTLADLVVDATGDLTWYEDEEGTVELPETTELVDETTYYVSQTIGDCESELFAITVHLIMGVSDMDNAVIAVYPNPVTDFLNISAKSEVTQIEIFDTSGRRVSAIKNLNNNQIDFRNFAEGTYIIRLMVGKEIKTVKVIKK